MDIITFIIKGDVNGFTKILEDNDGNRNNPDIVNGATPICVNTDGRGGMPLMYNMVEYLIDHFADVNKTYYATSSLNISVQENLYDTVDLLLEKGAAVRTQDLLLSLKKQFWDISELLLKKDFDECYIDETGTRFLHHIVCGNVLHVANALLRKNPRCTTIKDSFGRTALQLAEEKEYNEMAILIKQYIVLHELDQANDVHMEKYNNHQGAISKAKKDYSEKIAKANYLRAQVRKTEEQLKLLVPNLEIADKEVENSRNNMNSLLEQISNTIHYKDDNLLECPVCMIIPRSPKTVLLCMQGHSVCSVCRNNITHCPECREELQAIMVRNRQMEALINAIHK